MSRTSTPHRASNLKSDGVLLCSATIHLTICSGSISIGQVVTASSRLLTNRRAAGSSPAVQLETSRSGCLDLNLLRRFLRFRGFRQRDLEHAILERRLDLAGVHALRQCEIALERAIAALGDVIVLLLLFFFLLLLTLDGEAAVGDVHLDVLLVHSGQFGRNLVSLVSFADVDCRRRCELP